MASAFPQATRSHMLPENDATGGRTTGSHDAVSGQRGRPGCAHAPTRGRRLVPTPLGPKPRRFKGQRWGQWGTENNAAQSRLTENTDLRRSAGQAVLPEAFGRVPALKMAANLRPASSLPPPPPPPNPRLLCPRVHAQSLAPWQGE